MTHEKNRFFGEMGLIDSLPRSATAVTEDDAVILTISAEQMNKFFMDDPEVLLAVMRQLSDRTRELTGDYMEAVKTIAHNQKYAASGEAKPNWLVDNLKKFTKLWHDLSSTVGSNK